MTSNEIAKRITILLSVWPTTEEYLVMGPKLKKIARSYFSGFVGYKLYKSDFTLMEEMYTNRDNIGTYTPAHMKICNAIYRHFKYGEDI